MTVLIANQNQDIFKAWGVKKFTPSTENTSTFKVTQAKMQEFIQRAKNTGYNPYALMAW